MVVGQFAREAHLVVIGGGPAGAAAAARAAELGIETVLVDLQDRPVPPGVEIVRGLARFDGLRELSVAGEEILRLRFRRAVIATGARPLAPPEGWAEVPNVLDWDRALRLETVPGTMLVYGRGAAALALATPYAARGSAVTLVCPDAELLPEVDEDLFEPVALRLRESLASIRLGEGERDCDPARFDVAVAACGHAPATLELDLDKAQVAIDESGRVRVDQKLFTTNPRILAAGAVTGEPYSIGGAEQQGRIAAEVAAGLESAFDARALPWVIRSDPPIAWCGLTRRSAAAAGIAHEVAAARRSEGDRVLAVAKLLVEPAGRVVLGVGLCGRGAAETIGEGVLAVEMGAQAGDLAATVRSDSLPSRLLTEAARRLEVA